MIDNHNMSGGWRVQIGGTSGMWEYFPGQTRGDVLRLIAALKGRE